MDDPIPVQEVSSKSFDRESVRDDRKFEVPHAYGDNKITLMVRDPWTVFAYWEIKKEAEDSVRAKIVNEGLTELKSVLRVYSVTGDDPHNDVKRAFDFELRDWASNWYVHTREPGREWMVDIGILCTTGEFFCLVRSNVVRTPPHGMSDIYDEDWMCPEELYNKMFAAAGGYGRMSSGMFGSANFFTDKKK